MRAIGLGYVNERTKKLPRGLMVNYLDHKPVIFRIFVSLKLYIASFEIAED